jgi:hypothetical protein
MVNHPILLCLVWPLPDQNKMAMWSIHEKVQSLNCLELQKLA